MALKIGERVKLSARGLEAYPAFSGVVKGTLVKNPADPSGLRYPFRFRPDIPILNDGPNDSWPVAAREVETLEEEE